jgi:hypothetical protein
VTSNEGPPLDRLGEAAHRDRVRTLGAPIAWPRPVGYLVGSRLYLSLGLRPTVLIGGAVIGAGMVPLAAIAPTRPCWS